MTAVVFPAWIGAQACLDGVSRLHPIAQSALAEFMQGGLSWQAFARYFTLPHSDTLGAAACLIDKFAPLI